MGKLNSSLFSSKDHTWETPKDLFDNLNKVFDFNLDVCATDKTAKCNKYFTIETDGLKQKWKGNCWMNPPYGREQIKWINKAYNEHKENNSTIVCLIPARPDTKVWHDIIFKYAKAVCFIKGRLKFGNSKDSAPFPNAIIVFSNILKEEQINYLNSIGKLFINN